MSHPYDAQRQNGSSPRTVASSTASPDISYQADAAHYVAAMIAELRQISGKAGFEKLVGALDTAYYEAYTLIEPKPAAPGKPAEKTSEPVEPARL
jgi:hypothetical protein